MENKFINRYNTFCKSLQNLEKSKIAMMISVVLAVIIIVCSCLFVP